ncbi:MAG: dinitrogenase iron-molybdenum cofactor biosynthesis protein [Deltaproteobacteria bacterium]|nr:MAG: dinitrogenase iron-molybdenum cofactor biosynthesis protein [Deltaproteobacteria bacterium]
MKRKLLIPLSVDDVAPRFDLATEALILVVSADGEIEDERSVVLAQASAEKLSNLIISEHIQTLICGGIEAEYYEFFKWKQIDVYDFISGPWKTVFSRYQQGRLRSGDMLFVRTVEGKHV